ncbi:poly(3-hydroxybutyrate) depolymerase [Paucimonas lemoignei]|uniref:Poly(3-hydroxybutyrate) depolymerase n=1 Tax=Paucimonas lemoignei TaxID=29443 RepID=Q51870_PAULE|nr:PHB depolymerase family esterase [Paucimonas lemoignei]AAA65703.1 polyhydroxyalkanoate depolymerase precursor [Paucimonas lemoignei]TCS37815.1 poly(3-hydroxybutyrate) depolymerase [Paucimonas lemoignei]
MQLKKSLRVTIAVLLGAGVSASAFALTPGSGTWVKESATYGTPNLQDAYLYVPKNPAPQVLGGKRALMLSLHGCGQTASTSVIDKRFNWEETAEKYGMVVVAPTVPTGTSSTRAASGCWDWFGTAHNRTTRDVVPLIKLIDAVKARTNLDIDPNQIYVSGLSAGAGETHVLGCSFPDYFAGVAPNASPSLGSAAGDISVPPKRTPQQVADMCRAINGNQFNAHLDTQIFATVYGDKDYLVLPAHNEVNRDGMKIAYDATVSAGTASVDGGGTASLFKDSRGRLRISSMVVAGMSHAWPSGPGAAPYIAWVDSTRVNYPAYVTQFFFENNLRVNKWKITCSVNVPNASSATVSASATAAAGATVASYRVALQGKTAINDNAAGSGTSLNKSYNLGNGIYAGTVTAVDSKGVESEACQLSSFQVGQLDPLYPPSDIQATGISSSSIKLNWSAVSSATAYDVRRNGGAPVRVTATQYTDTGLAPDTSYSYTVTSVNDNMTSGQSGQIIGKTQPVTYTEKVTATVTGHYSAGRINVNQYLQLGAKYGYNASLTLYKCEGVWTNSSSCGPLQ